MEYIVIILSLALIYSSILLRDQKIWIQELRKEVDRHRKELIYCSDHLRALTKDAAGEPLDAIPNKFKWIKVEGSEILLGRYLGAWYVEDEDGESWKDYWEYKIIYKNIHQQWHDGDKQINEPDYITEIEDPDS